MKKGKSAPRKASIRSPNAKRMVTAASLVVLPMAMTMTSAGAQATGAKTTISPTNPAPPAGGQLTAEQYYTAQIKQGNIRAIKLPGTYTILGVNEGHTIYKGADGQYFYLDPNTGDKRALSTDYFLKIQATSGLTFGREKLKGTSAEVTFLGIDKAGNVLQKNQRGEVFYLNAKTGDQVFVPVPR